MIVVLSPDYLLEKSISVLEFKLGLLCQNNIATKLVVVEYRPLQCTHPSVQQLKQSVAFVPWQGEKSKRPGSKFWKALRLALPLRSLSTAASNWNESCSSHSDASLEQLQKKRSQAGGQSQRPNIPVQRGVAPLPRLKAREQSKPFLACRCCVAYCNEHHKLRSHRQGTAKPKEPQAAGESKGLPLQSCEKPQPPASQMAALSLHQHADLSNNHDFYAL